MMKPTDTDLTTWHMSTLLAQYGDSHAELVQYAELDAQNIDLDAEQTAQRLNEDAWTAAIEAELLRRIER